MKRMTGWIAIIAMLATTTASAGDEEDFVDAGRNPNPIVFRIEASPYGTDMHAWAERLVQWIYRQPLAQNPVLDQSGAYCAVDQRGPVWFIPPIDGPAVFTGTRTCTIPHGKSILLQLGGVVALYPRGDRTDYAPAAGETLSHFLRSRAAIVMDSVNRLEVTLDGRALKQVLDYRIQSEGLFELTPHPTLVGTYDARLVGWGQPAVSDGFFMMFKPLQRGSHTLRVVGTNTFGDDKTYVYYLHIQ